MNPVRRVPFVLMAVLLLVSAEAWAECGNLLLESRTPDVVIKSARFFSTIESDICQ